MQATRARQRTGLQTRSRAVRHNPQGDMPHAGNKGKAEDRSTNEVQGGKAQPSGGHAACRQQGQGRGQVHGQSLGW